MFGGRILKKCTSFAKVHPSLLIPFSKWWAYFFGGTIIIAVRIYNLCEHYCRMMLKVKRVGESIPCFTIQTMQLYSVDTIGGMYNYAVL